MATGTPHKAKPSTKTSLRRSAHHKTTGKYVRQRVRTEARRARRIAGDTCRGRRFARRRASR